MKKSPYVVMLVAALLIEVVMFVASSTTAVARVRVIKLTSRAYSMAEAPFSSFTNRQIVLNMA
jgi:hypothetical protein